MIKAVWIFALGIMALGGCGSVTVVGSATEHQAARNGAPLDIGPDCQTATVGFKTKGGKVGFPSLPAEGGQFYGHVFYAPYVGQDVDVSVAECPGTDNSFDVPVPNGYTPDLFEYLNFFDPKPKDFGTANLFGEIYSTTWVSKVKYVLYLYDDHDNLLLSSEMGPLKKKIGALKFESPFENGLTVPPDGVLNLEIAHPTP